MVKGWFVGDFEPTLYKTKDVEIAVKPYEKGFYEKSHHHKIATEITVVITGKIRANGVEYGAGDILIMEPGESTDFECIAENTSTVVAKLPSTIDDKYFD